MHTQAALDRVVGEWLARTHPSPDRVRMEWSSHRVALLPLGVRFAAVRMPGDVVHAAVGSCEAGEVSLALSELLGGPVIYDRRAVGETYYALIQAHAALAWAYGNIVTCLGEGTYLGVPRLDQRLPPGTYWVIPPRYEGDLCAPRSIVALIHMGRGRQSADSES